MEIKSLRGMNDIIPPESKLWSQTEEIIRKHFAAFGFKEIRTPVLESTDLFSRSVGDSSDIVNKEMYTFQDRGGDSVTLRPEGTAPVVRAVVEHGLLNNESQQKLFYIGPMYRYERPQKGRYRQFHQYGIEAFGISDPSFDAELISVLVSLYEKFELKNLTVELSSLGCGNCRPLFKDRLVAFLKPLAPQLCSECQDRMNRNPLRVLDCKNPNCKKLTQNAPCVLDILCGDCQTHFDGVKKNLEVLKTPFLVNKRMVRGLDYYNRTVFEITTGDLGAQNAVGGGGRYDDLVSQLGGPETPAIGFAGGLERLILLLQEVKKADDPRLDLFFVCPDQAGREFVFPLAFELRLKGLNLDLDYQGKSMKAQMKRADKLRAKFVVIVGSGEIDKGAVTIRDMDTKVQTEIKLTELRSELTRRML